MDYSPADCIALGKHIMYETEAIENDARIDLTTRAGDFGVSLSRNGSRVPELVETFIVSIACKVFTISAAYSGAGSNG